MKKTIDNLLWGLLIVLITIALFFVAVLTTIVVKEVVRDKPSATAVEFECESDCIRGADGSLHCDCHPVK